MNQNKFISTLLCSAMTSFLISCGGGGGSEEKATTDTTTAKTDTTTTTGTTAQPAASTISTTPEDAMVATAKVKDYTKWKMAYDGHDSARLANGIHNFVIGRGVPDSNMVFVATKVDDRQKAKAFWNSPGLKKSMQQSGVVGAPMMSLVTMVYQDKATISTDLRAKSTFTVKDWDRWQKAFDSTMKLNTDNGLVVRAYGHNADDNHKVILVSAITDTAKARAFWNSDLIKQRRAAGGVVGQPQRFIYHVVQLIQ